jgi:hypothetical protein
MMLENEAVIVEVVNKSVVSAVNCVAPSGVTNITSRVCIQQLLASTSRVKVTSLFEPSTAELGDTDKTRVRRGKGKDDAEVRLAKRDTSAPLNVRWNSAKEARTNEEVAPVAESRFK